LPIAQRQRPSKQRPSPRGRPMKYSG
jgi:hypothetical protein